MTTAHRPPEPPDRPAPGAGPASPYAPRAGEYRDWSGRRYTVGPSARALTGRDRSHLLGRAALALAAVGVLQFGYGAAVPLLIAAHGWSPVQALLPFAVWALVQAGSAAPVARLRERGALPPSLAVPLGSVLAAAGPASLPWAADPLWAVLGHGLLGGAGAGLVYHSCVHLAAAWYPERPALHTAFTGAAFALGSVPLVAAAGLGPPPEVLAPAALALAVLVGAVGAACGLRLAEPPPRWWPPETDPRGWALRPRTAPPASRDHSPAEAWRSGALPRLHLVVAASGAAALFDAAVLPLLLTRADFPPGAVAAAAAAVVAGSGLGRIAAGGWAERGDRRTVLAAALACGAVAHAGLAAAVAAGAAPALVCFAAAAGIGGGSCYPLTRELAVDFFGVRDSARIQGLVYSAKGVGGLVGVGGAAALLALAPAAWTVAAPAAAGAAAGAAALAAARLRRPLSARTLPLPST
ncbi:MFS transporter [Nocardiopsis sp. CNT-189]|uniref:MFS transporter n=1 Tax=Nocardiopsis oceanisediminis TaxID=2816862 RepID=UPI003B308131